MKHAHHWKLDGPEMASRGKGEDEPHVDGRCHCGKKRRFRIQLDATSLGDSYSGTYSRDPGALRRYE